MGTDSRNFDSGTRTGTGNRRISCTVQRTDSVESAVAVVGVAVVDVAGTEY